MDCMYIIFPSSGSQAVSVTLECRSLTAKVLTALIAFAVTLLVASASYYWMEKPL